MSVSTIDVVFISSLQFNSILDSFASFSFPFFASFAIFCLACLCYPPWKTVAGSTVSTRRRLNKLVSTMIIITATPVTTGTCHGI